MLLLMLLRQLRALAARRARQPGPGASEDPAAGGGTAARPPAATAGAQARGRELGGGPARFPAELRGGPPVSRMDMPPVVTAVQLAVLVVVVVTVPLSTPRFGESTHGIAVAAALALSAAAWAVWIFAGRRPWLWLVMLAVMGAFGGALAGLASVSTAVAVGFVVTMSAGARLPVDWSLAVTAETTGAFLLAATAGGAPAEAIIGWSAVFVGLWAFGLTRRAYLLRAVEAEQALEQAGRARAAETQAAALAERARIAREIHDILAQALAAVAVNLQAAGGLLDAVPGKGPELVKAAECVERAGALTREGMTEARRAILALRDDAADASPGSAARPPGRPGANAAGRPGAEAGGPLAEGLSSRLRALADSRRADGDAAVEFTVAGTPRPLGAEAALAVYRTAQEALTNVRKHAPGQPARVALVYLPGDTTLLVTSALPPPGKEGPLARTGAGYGLTGLRERAALAGGTLTAGPENGQWRVHLSIPA